MSANDERESILPIERFVNIFNQKFRIIVPHTRKNQRILLKVEQYADCVGAPTQEWIKHRYALDSKMSVNDWVSYMTLPPWMFDDFLDRVQELHHLNLRE